MDEKLLTLVLNSGVASERREACEFLDLKTRVEEEKYRQLSADLERRRIRKYNLHLEEKRKVEKELDNLQKDRLRFEREKQLRKRKNFSASRRGRKKQDSKPFEKDEKITLPMNEDALGGSASIAFDPEVEKCSRRRRRKAKTESCIYNSRKVDKDLSGDVPNFPYLSEGEVKKFHQSCKSAGKRTECRRWGAAWLYAKKEQETVMTKSERWTTLLLNAEKENMRVLCEKLIAIKKKTLPKAQECWNEFGIGTKSNLVKTSLSKENKYDAAEKFNKLEELGSKKVMEDGGRVKDNVGKVFENNDESKRDSDSKSAAKGQSRNFPNTKLENVVGVKNHSSRKIKKENDVLFVSPFSKSLTLAKQLAFEQNSLKDNVNSSKSSKKTDFNKENETRQITLLQDVSSGILKSKSEKTKYSAVKFLPDL